MFRGNRRGSSEIVRLSARARDKIRSLMPAGPPALAVRIYAESGGCSRPEYGMAFDRAKPSDRLIESEGLTLVIDPKSLHVLGRHLLVDYRDHEGSAGFRFLSDRRHEACGCGA